MLFDPALFELRHELQRDKGIDLTVEIKQHGYYTNFRFAIQLKATAVAKANKDGSRSFSVDISNIHYLLNYGMPAYYILYDATADLFYLEPVNRVFQVLMTKYKPDRLPKQFKIRFGEQLTADVIAAVYKQTLENGEMLRKLSPHLKQGKGLLIDEDNDVYSVEQNIAFIDHFGFDLMNNKEFTRIIEIEQRTHPRTKASPTFNLVCGIAYYQRANLFKAIELLKLADQEKSGFDPDARSLLTYNLLHAKYLLGMLDEKVFRKAISDLLRQKHNGSFLQLQKAFEVLTKSKAPSRHKMLTFYKSTEKVIQASAGISDVLIMGYARVLDMLSKLMLHELANNTNFIIGRGKAPMRELIKADWLSMDEQYSTTLDKLIRYAVKEKNFLGASNLILDKTNWVYANAYYNYAFDNWDSKERRVQGDLNNASRVALSHQVTVIDNMIKTYEMVHHIENQYSALYLKYELLHFLGRTADADATARLMENIIAGHELNGLKNKFKALLEGGTSHEKFIAALNERINHIYQIAVNSGIEEYMFTDVPEDPAGFLKQIPEWSFKQLPSMEIPS